MEFGGLWERRVPLSRLVAVVSRWARAAEILLGADCVLPRAIVDAVDNLPASVQDGLDPLLEW